MTIVWPVIVLVRHMVTTWSAMSSLSAAILSNDCDAACSICDCRRFEVARVPSRRPGATQLTSTWGDSATAKHFVRWIKPAFDTAYAIEEPLGARPAIEAMLTMRPFPCACITGATAFIQSIG